MPEIKQYPAGRWRLERSTMEGFTVTPAGELRAESDRERHALFLRRFDSAEEDCAWGRFAFDLRAGQDAVVIVRAFASNHHSREVGGEVQDYDAYLLDSGIPAAQRLRLLEELGGIRSVGHSDVLLYGQTGRYLWVSVEVIGKVEARLSRLRVYAPGDNFLQTFPEIYRLNGEFLHRYLSIFSTMYQELQEKIDALADILDLDRAPAFALPLFAKWLGIEIDGDILGERHLRQLLKSAGTLIAYKGTRRAVEEVLKIFVDDAFNIVEHRILQDYMAHVDRAVYDRLYGANPFGVTVLIRREPDEKLHSLLLFLLDQFKPLRCVIRLVFLRGGASLNEHSYLDVNACVLEPATAALDGAAVLGDLRYMQ